MTTQTGTNATTMVVAIPVTLESLGFAIGQMVEIQNRIVGGKEILKGRSLQLTGVSKKKPGLVLGQLVAKTGLLQKCEITMPVECIFEIKAEVVPVVEEIATEAAMEVEGQAVNTQEQELEQAEDQQAVV